MLGLLNADTKEFKQGLRVQILNEYHDKTTCGDYVYVVRVIDDNPEHYINNHKSKYLTDKIDFESKHGSIELFSRFRIDIIQ
ncbi:hypothetical protein [Brevibacillus laterosporus]|uniref:hypothetical protein n=1 Tax=Brevibacillus laterosporus TaxID=1465 RepID=UPI002E1AF19D|nr:hypothetical protein [Brevibacillus laterosporus]MED1667225.1 hypothetical protein [Brevibacillus laterosporus]MED1719707.1 hypothetical protein [Brevibacillus laterosporus]